MDPRQHLKSCADGAWRELLQVEEAKPWAPRASLGARRVGGFGRGLGKS